MKRQIFDTQALNALPISEVAEKYTNVVRKGASLFCLCPCHDDHHPSMDVTGKKVNRAKCYSCGKSLSVIDFVMAIQKTDFKGACEELGGTPLPYLPRGGGVESRRFGKVNKGNEKKLKKESGTELLKRQKEIVERSIRRHQNLRVTVTSPSGVGTKFVTECHEMRSLGRGVFFIPESFIVESADNTFCECLRSLFVPEGIDWAVKTYRLGSYKLGEKDGYVMFPSIDTEGRCHNIKIQRYCTDKSSPQFFHREKNANYWLASILQNRGELPAGNYDSTCFFGEHLLPQYPSATVVLVESPKNAVLGALGYGDYIWIAAGNKNNLSRERLQCLQNRKVIVIPDNDALDEWKQKLNTMQDIATFVFSSFCDIALGQTGAKGDVGDYIIERV